MGFFWIFFIHRFLQRLYDTQLTYCPLAPYKVAKGLLQNFTSGVGTISIYSMSVTIAALNGFRQACKCNLE